MVWNIGIVGFGRMGKAIAMGLINSGMNPSTIAVYDKEASTLQHAKTLGLKITSSNTETILNSDIVILAVKPNDIIKVVN
ncbi:MAG: NAD(P)-binding domain-containing protein, partial [Ignisphaera sp.]